MKTPITIGELISLFYQRFMELYGDEDLASAATAAVINDFLSMPDRTSPADFH